MRHSSGWATIVLILMGFLMLLPDNPCPPLARLKKLGRILLRPRPGCPTSARATLVIPRRRVGSDTPTHRGKSRHRQVSCSSHRRGIAAGALPLGNSGPRAYPPSFFISHAMLRASVLTVSIPSASFCTSPFSRPKATFQ